MNQNIEMHADRHNRLLVWTHLCYIGQLINSAHALDNLNTRCNPF